MGEAVWDYDQSRSLQLLQSVLQHWSIMLFQNILAYVNDKIFANAKDVVIKGRMMNFAE